MSSEEKKNKALVRRFVEAQAEKDLAALEEMLAPDFVDHSVLPGQGTTREDYLQDVAEDQAASSDARLRGCADRSWSAGRSAFPSVVHPAFSNQPPHHDHHLQSSLCRLPGSRVQQNTVNHGLNHFLSREYSRPSLTSYSVSPTGAADLQHTSRGNIRQRAFRSSSL